MGLSRDGWPSAAVAAWDRATQAVQSAATAPGAVVQDGLAGGVGNGLAAVAVATGGGTPGT
jgi:hypothetical protein